MNTIIYIIKLISKTNTVSFNSIPIERKLCPSKNNRAVYFLSSIFHCGNVFGSLRNEIRDARAKTNLQAWY